MNDEKILSECLEFLFIAVILRNSIHNINWLKIDRKQFFWSVNEPLFSVIVVWTNETRKCILM